MNDELELLQTKLGVFAEKLSLAFDIESRYVYELKKAHSEIANLKEKLSVFEAQETD